uniref:Uncharacterized protein n=1 Tax=Arundo donax TaxID=35708 RepID=A0A0A9CFV6_ARUDO
MVANMVSIIADIGERSAPAADGAGSRVRPSRICIGISSSTPALTQIPRAGAPLSGLDRHGPHRRDLRTAFVNPPETGTAAAEGSFGSGRF